MIQPMLLFEIIVEQKILAAMERGEFDDLPGQGRPLDLREDPLVPEELRMAYRLLKNAGFIPPELEAQKEIRDLEHLTQGLGAERSKALRKLQFLSVRLAESRRGRADLRLEADYFDKLIERLGCQPGIR
jgi:hypothetical protein